MAVFGFVTGLRGTNSALRYRGDDADINCETGVCYVRRAAGRLGETRNITKQKKPYRNTLPSSLLAILRWYVDTQIPKGAPRDSNYLFPSDFGEPRDRPGHEQAFCGLFAGDWAAVRSEYQRDAPDVPRPGAGGGRHRSISGHQDAKMQARYTSFWGPRQLEAFDSIMGLVTGQRRRVFVATPEAPLITQGSASPSEAA